MIDPKSLYTVRFVFDIEMWGKELVEDPDGDEAFALDDRSYKMCQYLISEMLKDPNQGRLTYHVICEEDYMAGQICQLPLGHEGSHR